MLEETHYYPFGLRMAGISSNALKGSNYAENRMKYNGIEYTNELDLDIYDAQLRNLDPQIGRWNQIDPKIENMEAWSPYASNYDNPIRYNDFLGDEGEDPNTGGFLQGIKIGFTDLFKNAGNAIASPGQTVKAMFSPQAILDNGLNVATMGGYGIAKGVVDNTRVIVNEGTYGLGKVVGAKVAEATIAVATEGAGKAIGAIRKGMGAASEGAALNSKVLDYAKENGIYSGQKNLRSNSYVEKYKTQMQEGTFDTERGAAGFIDKGRTILTDGNHRMNAAIQYAIETGDNKFVQSLIRNGNFRAANIAEYGINVYNLPVKPRK